MQNQRIFLLIFLAIFISGCVPVISSIFPTPSGVNLSISTMTQTVPIEITPTSTPDLVLFSMPLPLNADYYGPEYLSPDSKWITLYLPQSKKSSGITYVSAQILISQRGSGIWKEVLSEEEQIDPSYEFAYSPDNHYLAAQGRSGIWIIDLQDLNKKYHYNTPIIRGRGSTFIWTPDSKSVLFVIEDEKYFLVQMDFNGKIKPLLTISEIYQGKSKLDIYDILDFRGVTFSPDNKKMVYESHLPGNSDCQELWMYDLVTSKKELIIDHWCGVNIKPIWSPVGSKLVILDYFQINLINLNTGYSTIVYKMKEGSHLTQLFWSHDGKKILFNDPSFINDHRPIFIYDIDKKELRTVLMGEYLPIGWGNSDDTIFVVYQPWGSAEKYLQEIRID